MTTLSNSTTAPTNVNNERSQIQLNLDINPLRVIAVADQLAMYAKSNDFDRINSLCLSLASVLDDMVGEALNHNQGGNFQHVLRGIDYGLSQNEVPAHASKLPSILKLVCSRKNEFVLVPAIMVLLISVKNACKLNWFPAQDKEELLALADEVASNFVTRKDFNFEVSTIMPTVSTIMSRYYPHFKLGNVLVSLEVKSGYGTHLVDFHITKDTPITKEEGIYLFVAMKDNIDTSSCIITPQEVNILLNGDPVERRNRSTMDSRPQLPTAVNRYLKYGINLLQLVGQFSGDYIIMIGLMSYTLSSSGLRLPPDYEQPVSSISLDPEVIEGSSLVSLNCPISKTRIKTPVKGQLCKHYQCFDFTNYVEMNFKRPSWHCPTTCNQSVTFTDLRVDQKMIKALQEVGEKESKVIFSTDGSFKPASTNKHKDDSHNKTLANQPRVHELDESPMTLDGQTNMFDLTGEDDDMDISDFDQCELVDTKPVINNPLTSGLESRHEAQIGAMSGLEVLIGAMSGPITGNSWMVPVSTDAISPSLTRQPDTSQGVNLPLNSSFTSNSTPTSIQEALFSQAMGNRLQLTRNITRVSSAIQALPVQAPITGPHHHSRPSMSLPMVSEPQVSSGLNFRFSSSHGGYFDMPQSPSRSYANTQLSNTASVSAQNCSTSPSLQQGVGLSIPTHNSYISHTLSQPPHMRSSPLPRNPNHHGAGPRPVVNNSSTTTHQVHLQHVQLTGPQPPPHMRPPLTTALQTRPPIKIPTLSSGSGLGPSVAPQPVSRPENLINLQLDQNWRPTVRMRGALSGEQYNQALNQLIPAQNQAQGQAQAQSPRPRPSVPLPGASRSSIEILLANRRVASEVPDRSANRTQVEGSQRGNNVI